MKKIVILSLFLTNLYAASFKGDLASLDISFAQSFRLYKDFLGLPYVLIKKEKDGKNTSISITPTGVKKLDLDPLLLKENYDQYKQGRENWAKKRGQTINGFLPFKSFKNKSNALVFFAGYKYSKGNLKNVDVSYYVLCPKEAFQLKLLTQEIYYSTKFQENLQSSLLNSKCP